jgi:hypothetical protein
MHSPFVVNVTVEHGQLHESLASEVDRQEMISRLDAILSGPDSDLRDGVIQILIDQLRTDNGHEPLIVRTNEQITWQSELRDQTGAISPITVNVDRYPDRPPVPRPGGPRRRTPHIGPNFSGNPFNLAGNGSQTVHSGPYDTAKSNPIQQRFYKFEIEGTDALGNRLRLDPCIICER